MNLDTHDRSARSHPRACLKNEPVHHLGHGVANRRGCLWIIDDGHGVANCGGHLSCRKRQADYLTSSRLGPFSLEFDLPANIRGHNLPVRKSCRDRSDAAPGEKGEPHRQIEGSNKMCARIDAGRHAKQLRGIADEVDHASRSVPRPSELQRGTSIRGDTRGDDWRRIKVEHA